MADTTAPKTLRCGRNSRHHYSVLKTVHN
uniref:Uncharacterized protein n=1 Tax=Rhizophora mucronata TaxID=61149 RepID=A0A2P2N9B2_RHIMU